MEISLEKLQESKRFVNPKNKMFSFEHPMDYLAPFQEIMQGIDVQWTFKVDSEVVNADRESEVENTAYGRFAAIARMPVEYNLNVADITPQFNNMYHEIGLVYALDTTKPEIKAFSGKKVDVCLNQTVFGADNVTSVLMAGLRRNDIYTYLHNYAKTALEETLKYRQFVERLVEQKLVGSQLHEHIGDLVLYAMKDKYLGITSVMDAIKMITDEKTMYYGMGDAGTNKWITYNACTKAIQKANMFDEPTRAIALQSAFFPN